MNRRVPAIIGAVFLYGAPAIRAIVNVIGWASLPEDLRTWGALYHAVFGQASVLDIVCIIGGSVCLALALGFDPRRLFSRGPSSDDLALASRADLLAEELFAAHVQIQQDHSARHMDGNRTWDENMSDLRAANTAAAMRYQARTQAIFMAAQHRGLNLDFKMMGGMEHGGLDDWARALCVLAEAMRAGTYQGKTLRVDTFEQKVI